MCNVNSEETYITARSRISEYCGDFTAKGIDAPEWALYAIDALEEKYDRDFPKQLTRGALSLMRGAPVYCVANGEDTGKWYVNNETKSRVDGVDASSLPYSTYGSQWAAFLSKKKEE